MSGLAQWIRRATLHEGRPFFSSGVHQAMWTAFILALRLTPRHIINLTNGFIHLNIRR
jgi:hypothetical protein